jgi:hypothetical protein
MSIPIECARLDMREEFRRACSSAAEHYLRTTRLRWKLRLENWVFSIARKRRTKTLWSLFAIERQVGKLAFYH